MLDCGLAIHTRGEGHLLQWTPQMQAVDVFTPNTFPAHTYIPRDEDFEGQVGNGLRTTNIVVSISGPSKSGKSVLLQRVVGKDNLIRLFGPQIRSPEDLWDATFDWMGKPDIKCQPSDLRNCSLNYRRWFGELRTAIGGRNERNISTRKLRGYRKLADFVAQSSGDSPALQGKSPIQISSSLSTTFITYHDRSNRK